MNWERPPERRAPERGGPPQDFEEVLRWLAGHFRKSPGASFRWLFTIVGVAVVVFFIFSSYYTVQPQETAVIQRFGEFLRTADSGLHFKIPFGVDTVTKVVTGQVLQREYGYRTTKAGVRSEFQQAGYQSESLMLSGDLDVVDVHWTVQYLIRNPEKYLFHLRGVESTLDDISQAVMRQIVGNHYSDDILTTGRAALAIECQKQIQQIMDSYGTGVQIVAVKLQDVNPPAPVQPAFNEVNEAKQDRARTINEAEQTYNDKIPEASGQAKQNVAQAQAYATEQVNRASGKAQRFIDILAQYQKAPDITRKRMYLESFADIMGKSGHLYVVDSAEKNILPLLDLGKLGGQGAKARNSGSSGQQ
ncbi:MAG: FtsH protease activity modulator HflK [Syntrophobacteraceae bacterium]|nr:FtsH protease activity modulator HflK [Syntrophobacteraceae bacterium]